MLQGRQLPVHFPMSPSEKVGIYRSFFRWEKETELPPMKVFSSNVNSEDVDPAFYAQSDYGSPLDIR